MSPDTRPGHARHIAGGLECNCSHRAAASGIYPGEEEPLEPPASNRSTLVEYAQIFGVDIPPEDESLERSAREFLGFLSDLANLGDLSTVAPAAVYDPAWPDSNEVNR